MLMHERFIVISLIDADAEKKASQKLKTKIASKGNHVTFIYKKSCFEPAFLNGGFLNFSVFFPLRHIFETRQISRTFRPFLLFYVPKIR